MSSDTKELGGSMKSTDTFKEIRLLHTKYQDRTMAIDEEIGALKREKDELMAASAVVADIYFNAISSERDIDIDVVHQAMKSSWAELDSTQKLSDYTSQERVAATPISSFVDPALWTLFAMKIREDNWLSLPKRIERMMTETVTKNAFIVERAIDEYEGLCKQVWDYCEPETDFDAVVEKVAQVDSEGEYSDDDDTRVFGQDHLFEARLAARACARVRQARARLVDLVGKR